MPNAFMLDDITGTLLAFVIFPLFVLLPGFVIGSLTNILSFNFRSAGFRLAIALLLSVSICPVISFIAVRYGGFNIALLLYFLSTVLAVIFAFLRLKSVTFENVKQFLVSDRIIILLVGLWLCVSLFSLVDLQFYDTLYQCEEKLDYSHHVATTDAITRTGVPPVNPLFHPGYAIKQAYHYFWYLICSFVDQAGGDVVGPRVAVIAGAIWGGLALMAAIALCCRTFSSLDGAGAKKLACISVALLWVSGLDIWPVGMANLANWFNEKGLRYYCIEFWNEVLTGWIDMMLWVPHCSVALSACLFGSVLLVSLQDGEDLKVRDRLIYAVLAALSFASAVGMSVYIAFVFACAWIIWCCVCLLKRQTKNLQLVLVSGLLSVVFAFPFIADLRNSDGAVTKGSAIEFAVRRFEPVQIWLLERVKERGIEEWPVGIDMLTRFVTLPVNYFFELGFYLVAAVIYWQARRGKPITTKDLFLITLLLVSGFIATFMRSTLKYNDLGFRGILPAQLVLLLWSAQCLMLGYAAINSKSAKLWPHFVLGSLLFLGLASTAYDLWLLRFASFSLDRLHPVPIIAQGRFDVRQQYAIADKLLRTDAIIQHNPDVWTDAPSGLYSHRQTVVADQRSAHVSSGQKEDSVFAGIRSIFVNATPEEALAVCRRYKIDALVIKSTDPVVWDKAGWTAFISPVSQNRSSRLYVINPEAIVPAYRERFKSN